MDELNPRIRAALASISPSEENPAFHGCPTALGVLRGVSPAAAVWRPYPGANNIREIALHIAFWENSVANRLSGKNVSVGFKQHKTGWAEMLESIDDAQWKEELALVKAIHQRLTEALIHFDPAMLDQIVGKKTIRSAVYFIHGVAEHTLYHTAQMEMIKKMGMRHE